MENVRQENASVVVPNKDMNIGQFPPGKASPRQAHQMKDANKPWSIRNQARREAAQDIEEGKEPEKPKVMTRARRVVTVSYTHLRAHETGRNLVCRLLLEKKKK